MNPTPEQLKAEHEEIRKKLLPLREEVARLEKRQHEIELEHARIVYGIDRDVIVTANGRDYRVVAVDPLGDFLNKPWLVANPRKADGTFGTAHRNLCRDWELKKS